MIIAIDGPAGSGKSTTARAVAGRLGYTYLDTGAMYRAVALAFLRAGEDVTADGAARLLPALRLGVRLEGDTQHVILNGEDVSEEIRTPRVSASTSGVAALADVRSKLVEEQRRIARNYEQEGGGVVVDGRDIGTVVFPRADVKVFMVADEQVRAQRRFDELRTKGEDVTFDDVLEEIRDRDRKDSERSTAPLRKADGALELDTSELDVDEQVNAVIQAVKERRNLSTV